MKTLTLAIGLSCLSASLVLGSTPPPAKATTEISKPHSTSLVTKPHSTSLTIKPPPASLATKPNVHSTADGEGGFRPSGTKKPITTRGTKAASSSVTIKASLSYGTLKTAVSVLATKKGTTTAASLHKSTTPTVSTAPTGPVLHVLCKDQSGIKDYRTTPQGKMVSDADVAAGPYGFSTTAYPALGPVGEVYGVNSAGQLVVLWPSGTEFGAATVIPTSGYNLISGSYVQTVARAGAVNTTDVFAISTSGQILLVSHANATWSAPQLLFNQGTVENQQFVAAQGGSSYARRVMTSVYAIDGVGMLWVASSVNGAAYGPAASVGSRYDYMTNGAVAVAQHPDVDGQTDVFSVDGTGAMTVTSYDAWKQVWAASTRFGSTHGLFDSGGPILAALRDDGSKTLDVFTIQNDKSLAVMTYTSGAWGGPMAISAQFFAANPRMTGFPVFVPSTAPAPPVVFIIDASEKLNVFWLDTSGTWQGPSLVE